MLELDEELDESISLTGFELIRGPYPCGLWGGATRGIQEAGIGSGSLEVTRLRLRGLVIVVGAVLDCASASRRCALAAGVSASTMFSLHSSVSSSISSIRGRAGLDLETIGVGLVLSTGLGFAG